MAAPFRLAHLSDLHLGPLPPARARELLGKRALGFLSWHRRRRRAYRVDVVDALVADLREQAPDHTVVSGDLVNIALPAEFVMAAAWLRALGPPDRVTVVPGNHDAYVPLAWRKAWAHWSDYMAGDGAAAAPDDADEAFPFLRRRGPVAVVGLSSAVASPPTFATGKLGRRQLRRLDALMAGLAGEGGEVFRALVVHHPPDRTLTSFRRRLVDDKALGVVVARHGAELVLCGHEHRMKLGRLAGPRRDVPVVVAPSASLATPAGRHGGYLVYALERDTDAGGGWRVEVEVRAFDAASGRFGTTGRGALGAVFGGA